MPKSSSRWAVMAVAVLLLAAACASDDNGDTAPATSAGGTETTSGDPVPPGRAPGVDDDSITVAFSMLDIPFLESVGLYAATWGDQQAIYQALVDDLNERGGIGGRTIEPVYGFYNPASPAAAEETCTRLTQDQEVFAVIGGFVGPAETANICITGTNDTVLVGGAQTEEQLAQSTAPWLWTGALRARRLAPLFDLSLEEGTLTPESRVAIVAGIPAEDLIPEAERLLTERGIEVAATMVQDVAGGEIDAEDANWQVFAERIRTADADVVVLLSSTTAGIRGIRDNGLDVGVLVSDADELAAGGSSVTAEDRSVALTVAGLSGDELWNNPGMEDCRAVMEQRLPAGYESKQPSEYVEGEPQWYLPIPAYCNRMSLFEQVAGAAGDDLTVESFLAAAEAFGKSSLPASPYISIGPGKYDVVDGLRLARIDPEVGNNGSLVALTALVDITEGG